MRKTTLYIALLTLILSACTSPRREAMRQRLQYVSACNRADTLFSARWLPTVDSLVSYFDPSSRSWIERIFSLPFREGAGVGSNERMMAHYLQGRVHHDMGEAPQALECYQKAAEQADTTRDDCDLHTLMAIYGQMADLFHAQYLPDDEMQALDVAQLIAWKDKDTLAAIKAFELRVRPYFLKEEKDSMLYVMRQARNLYLKTNHKKEAAEAIYSAISIYLSRGQVKEAGCWLEVYEKESGNFDQEGNILKGGIYYYDKGHYLLKTGRTVTAIPYFRKALTRGFSEAGYRGLLMAYENLGQPDSVSKYAKLFAQANDSCYYHVNQEKIHQISAMYDYSRQQHLADESRTKVARLRYYLVFVFLAVLAATAIAAFIYNKVRTRNLLRITQLLRAKADLHSLLEEKQAQLDSVVSENSSVIEQVTQERNQLLIEHIREKKALEQQIEEMERQLSQFSRANHEKAFLSTTIGQRFQIIRESMPKEEPPTNLEWEQCIKTFRDHFPSYFSFITNGHALTDDQLRICVMIRLNYRESEMVFFMNTDKQRINRIKLQVNGKIFGIQNSSSLRKNLKEHF